MQQAARVFIGDETSCPGFQLGEDGMFRQPVLDLFTKAMELKIPHNVFRGMDDDPAPAPEQFPPGGHAGPAG
jgi:hypothetical protein